VFYVLKSLSQSAQHLVGLSIIAHRLTNPLRSFSSSFSYSTRLHPEHPTHLSLDAIMLKHQLLFTNCRFYLLSVPLRATENENASDSSMEKGLVNGNFVGAIFNVTPGPSYLRGAVRAESNMALHVTG
jgi:hypothetical protein